VVLCVTDDGVGISAEDLPHIFELFNQADRALDRAQGGLGIGLSLVRSILAMHGGSIRAESAGQGKGTRLIASLPLLTRLPHTPLPPATTVTASLPGVPHDIVIIDDNADSAEALAILLGLHGHCIRIAADGPSGLTECLSRWPDIVLLDIGLPIVDGYEVAVRLRGAADGRPLKLVALTGYGQPSDIERSRAAGFDHHVVKPVEPAVLMSLFESA
jgi:CheY-like chemotaxis protein